MPFLGPETFNFLKKWKKELKISLARQNFLKGSVSLLRPFDGHNFSQLNEILEKILELHGPRLVHVITKKEKVTAGEQTGALSLRKQILGKRQPVAEPIIEYREVFAEELVRQAENRPEVVAITRQ